MKLPTNLKQKLFTVIFGLAIFTGTIVITSCTAMAATVQPEAIIQPRSDILEWKYKIEDGKMYKRLYNATKDCWESEDWIYVCDYPQ